MEKVELTAVELYNAEEYLKQLGVIQRTMAEQGMPVTPLDFHNKTKWWLVRNADHIESETKRLNKIKNDLIAKFGATKADGTVGIDHFIDDPDADVMPALKKPAETPAEGEAPVPPPPPPKKANPKMAEFQKEWLEIVNDPKKIPVDIVMIKISELVNVNGEEVPMPFHIMRGLAFMFVAD